ncbi:oligosaccharide flippase family protein [Novosphingobium sp. MBES04]|uniref:oligosaccharide flippase family protein n=1 Tax=Novosphingobium sp. MBES04 TaxID=1206458 RepID=UPI00057E9F2E|nr:oligosaccharide flippase family protein [Novosphingobium sp. MBES04]
MTVLAEHMDKAEGASQPAAQTAARSGLGRKGGAGMLWMLSATLLARGSSFLAQIVLGWLLSQGDFGVYAAAMSVAAVMQGFRDGGARRILVQKGPSHWEALVGPVFWVSTGLNLLGAAVLVCAALVLPSLALLEGSAIADPRIGGVLFTIAAAFSISSFEAIAISRLLTQFRFRDVSAINMQRAFVQNGMMVVFAVLGFGPLSFALPVLIATVTTIALGFALTRGSVQLRRLGLRMWPAIIGRTKWLLLSALGTALLMQGDYLALGVMVEPALLGIYFFSYQIVGQLQILLAANLNNVLLPMFSSIQSQRDRFRQNVIKALRLLSFLGCGAGFGLAVAYPYLERMIWGAKWESSIVPVQVIAIAFPFRLLWSVFNSVLSSLGQFRKLAASTLLAGVGVALAAGVSGLISARAETIAAGVGLYFVFGLTGIIAQGLRSVGLTVTDTLKAVWPSWLLGLVAFTGVYILEGTFAAFGAGALGSFASLISASALFMGLYFVLMRCLLTAPLRDLISFAPKRLERYLRVGMLLRG